MMLRQLTGVSIPKLEEFLKISEAEEGETVTVAEVKEAFINSGTVVIKG